MTTLTVTLDLPADVYQRFLSSSSTLQEPVEKLLSQSIQGNLPPAIEDLPLELQDEVGVSLHSLTSQELWHIVNENENSGSWTRHQVLLEKNQDDQISKDEAEELVKYQVQMDNAVMRRSYALALLKWRGYSIPLAPTSGPSVGAN